MNAYEIKAKVLTDDRRVFVNILDIMLDTCKKMEEEESVFVCIAVNDRIKRECKTLDNIVERFEGLVYKDYCWQKEE